MAVIRLPNNWVPRPYQYSLWSYLESGGRRAVAIWHRRAGKDDVCLHWTATAAMKRPGGYWHMLPEASQARKAIWTAVNPHTGKKRIDEAFPMAMRKTTRDQDMFIEFVNGSTWQVLGSDNYDSTVGSPPVGLIFSEWALADPASWAYLMPILEENGGWALFISTPRGKNHCFSTYEVGIEEDDWFSQLLTVKDTNVFNDKQLDSIRRQLVKQYGPSRGEAMFAQEYYCSWEGAFGGKAVYHEFDRSAHVAEKPLLPMVCEAIKNGDIPVIRGWDHSGLHPACVLTCVIGRQWVVFKEFWEDDVGIIDFGELVKIWCAENLPGDTRYKDFGDPAGNKTRDAIKKTAGQYLRENCGISITPGIQTFKIRRESVANRLNRRDGFLMDPTHCPLLLSGFLGGYAFPEIGSSGVFKTEIKGGDKDKYCDVHDALQYPATKIFGPTRKTEQRHEEHQQASWAVI